MSKRMLSKAATYHMAIWKELPLAEAVYCGGLVVRDRKSGIRIGCSSFWGRGLVGDGLDPERLRLKMVRPNGPQEGSHTSPTSTTPSHLGGYQYKAHNSMFRPSSQVPNLVIVRAPSYKWFKSRKGQCLFFLFPSDNKPQRFHLLQVLPSHVILGCFFPSTS